MRKRGTVGAIALGLVAASCTPDYVTDNNAPVNLYITAVTNSSGGTVIDSDVRNGTAPETTICPDYATVSVAVRNKNPMAPTPNVPAAVVVDSYAVTYSRTDGRAVEGIDVPYRITGNLTAAEDVKDSGGTEIPIEIVRRQAKVEPPLNTIYQTALLTTMAEITVYGHTIAGERVSASGRVQVDFADYAGTPAECQVP